MLLMLLGEFCTEIHLVRAELIFMILSTITLISEMNHLTINAINNVSPVENILQKSSLIS